MSKITRVLQKIFATDGVLSDFGVFGSRTANNPTYSKDVLTIQSLAAWTDGLKSALNSANKAPFHEDTNSLYYVLTSQLAYLFQEGLPEYDATTNYFLYSVVKKTQTWELYGSLVDDNLGNALPDKVSDAYWIYLGDLRNLNITLPESYVAPNNKLYVGLAAANSFYPTGLITTRVPLGTVVFDVASEWNTTTKEATIKNAGYYQINAQVCAKSAAGALSRIICVVMKSDVEVGHSYGYRETSHPEGDGSNRVTATVSTIVYCNIGDKISLYVNPPETYTSIHGYSAGGYYTYLCYARLP